MRSSSAVAVAVSTLALVAFSLACGSGERPETCALEPTISVTYDTPVDGCVNAEVTGTLHGEPWGRVLTPTMAILEEGWSITNPGFEPGSGVFLNPDEDGIARVIVCGSGTATGTVTVRDRWCDSYHNPDGMPLPCSVDEDCNSGESCYPSSDTGQDGECRIEFTDTFEITI